MISAQQIEAIMERWRKEAHDRQEIVNEMFYQNWRKDMSNVTTRYRNSLDITRDMIREDYYTKPENKGRFYLVKSSDGRTEYSVDLKPNSEDPYGACSCDDFVYRTGPEGSACKHIYAVVREYGVYFPVPEPVTVNMTEPNADLNAVNDAVEQYLHELDNEYLNNSQEDTMVPEDNTRTLLFTVPTPVTTVALVHFTDAAQALVGYGNEVFVDVGTFEVDGRRGTTLVFYTIEDDYDDYN